MSRAGRWSLVAPLLVLAAVAAWWLTRSTGSAPAPPAAAMGPAWRVAGTVKDGNGKPIPGAEASLRLRLDGATILLPVAKTDAAGEYVVPVPQLDAADPTARDYATLTAWGFAPGHAASAPTYGHPFLKDPDREIRCDLMLQAGDTARGRVLDSASTPVADVVITLCSSGSDVPGRTITDPRGRYAIAIPRGGPFRVMAVRSSLIVGTPEGPTGGPGVAVSKELERVAGRDAEIADLALRGEGRIEGRCTYPDGTPASHIEVEASPPSGETAELACAEEITGLRFGYATADATGRFRIGGLRPGLYVVKLTRRALEPPVEAAAPKTWETGSRDVLVVCSAHRLVVKIVDEAGRPAWTKLLFRSQPPGSKEPLVGLGEQLSPFMTEPGATWKLEAAWRTAEAETTVVIPETPWETDVTLVLREKK